MTGTVDQIKQRTELLANTYTVELDAFVNEHVPRTLDNKEYAARCGALMIALSRQLARCAVSFGETHEIERGKMVDMVGNNFVTHYAKALEAVDHGAGGSVH